MTIELSDRELGTVLAGLRTRQTILSGKGLPSDDWMREIATNGGTLRQLRAAEIDALCMRLNIVQVPAETRCPFDYWTSQHIALARAEGWDLFQAADMCDIQRMDDPGILASDMAALDLCMTRALLGSPWHALALYLDGRRVTKPVDVPGAMCVEPKPFGGV